VAHYKGLSRFSTVIEQYLERWWVCIFFGLIATYMFTVLVPNGVAAVTQKRSLAPRIWTNTI
jgi:hypothetical protein